jgi:hypothetical protein
MKLLYDIQTGTVLGRYTQGTKGIESKDDLSLNPAEGNAIIDFPSTIPIPLDILMVISALATVVVETSGDAVVEEQTATNTDAVTVIDANAVANTDAVANAVEFIIDQALIDNQWRPIKEARNQRLKDSDWTCSVTDYVPPNKAEWISYRQALRDLTKQPNPFEITWPIAP